MHSSPISTDVHSPGVFMDSSELPPVKMAPTCAQHLDDNARCCWLWQAKSCQEQIKSEALRGSVLTRYISSWSPEHPKKEQAVHFLPLPSLASEFLVISTSPLLRPAIEAQQQLKDERWLGTVLHDFCFCCVIQPQFCLLLILRVLELESVITGLCLVFPSELFRSEQQSSLDLLQAVAMKTTLATSVPVPNHFANATCKISSATAVAPVTQL
ncbi:hypothetical protein Anapl_11883 [Anas platyrhynchos]|uniref:Uncharacterized protein n=1 Tax=Anas platyrhynchos TaxID=8839 RepID=R0LCH8_ANAPL|nr:hypothetical protein Anapl_11883 [Anas platyrhynchos]